ncbi:MAG: serine protease, partial [Bdellovibrionales bacterium]|nr:serine protease [Bdellovibrionales bacterium]
LANLLLTQNLRAGNVNVDAIYSLDDREMVSKKSPLKIQELARSIGYVVSKDLMTKGIFKTSIQAPLLKDQVNLCKDEKFANNSAGVNCTGFLVGSDVMVSAGHCFESQSDCENKKIIFDLDEKKQSSTGFSVMNSTVFSCKKIIARAFSGEEDYSIIQLEKAPVGRKALTLNLKEKISDDAQVFMIGHPMGLAQTFSKPAKIVENESELQFKAELDSFVGNSGSPIINAKTFQVEGILVTGQEDLVFDSQKQCYRNIVYENSGGEGAFRVIHLPAFN